MGHSTKDFEPFKMVEKGRWVIAALRIMHVIACSFFSIYNMFIM